MKALPVVALALTVACAQASPDTYSCQEQLKYGQTDGFCVDRDSNDLHTMVNGTSRAELTTAGALVVDDITVNDDLTVADALSVTGVSTLTGNVTVTGDLAVTGSITGSGSVVYKSYSLATANTGINYTGGFYDAPAADADLTQASLTQTLGDGADDEPWAAHAFLVASGAGTTDGSDLVVTVTGTSITDAGVRTASDSEVIIGTAADLTQCQIQATAATTDLYCETDKKWLGQITYTLSSTGGSTFNFTFNYGWAKYEDFGNRDFTVTDFECVGMAGASNTITIKLLEHNLTGWTYSAAAFVPGADAIVSSVTDHSSENGLTSGQPFAYKRAALSTAIDGDGSEGVVVEVSVGGVNVVDYMSCHLGVTF